ncbi:MAG TPA: hypothetical protein VLM38_20290 [Blastocatellia bacterium]|nr:hypothetical protein [Blastocatellia bacterium]
MDTPGTTLTHNEISLLLFALEGGNAAPLPDPSTCEDACPVVESVEELLCGGKLEPRHQLVRHLNNHLREALIECGMFELMATGQPDGAQALSVEDQTKLHQVNQRLSEWNCRIKLDDTERRLLYESLSRLPRSSWVTMPRTMWRLRKKLKLPNLLKTIQGT